MKFVWSGAGFVIPVLCALGFIALVLGVQQKGDFWVWGALAAALAMIVLPLGLVLNSKGRTAVRGGSQHHFMYIPMQYWGGLLLVAGVGLFVAETIAGDWSAALASDEPYPCVELGEMLSACPSLGPAGAGMLQAGCEASDPTVQASCLACVRSAADACTPSVCATACNFEPPGAP